MRIVKLGCLLGLLAAAPRAHAEDLFILTAGGFGAIETGPARWTYGGEASLWHNREQTPLALGVDAGLSRRAFYGEVEGALLPRKYGLGYGLGLGLRRTRGPVPRTGTQATLWLLPGGGFEFPGIPYLRVEADRDEAIASAGLMLKLPVSWHSVGGSAALPTRNLTPPPDLRLALRPTFGLRGPGAVASYGAELALSALLISPPVVVGVVVGATNRTQSLAAEVIDERPADGPRVALDLGAVRRWSGTMGLVATLWWMSLAQDSSPVFPFLRLERYADGAIASGGLMARIGR